MPKTLPLSTVRTWTGIDIESPPKNEFKGAGAAIRKTTRKRITYISLNETYILADVFLTSIFINLLVTLYGLN